MLAPACWPLLCVPLRPVGIACTLSDDAHVQLRRERHPALMGVPLSPSLDEGAVLVRYMYDGGVLSQGRLCRLTPASTDVATSAEVLDTLRADGVDLARFYACVYETASSTGGWLPIDEGGDAMQLDLPDVAAETPSRRIDVKLCARQSGRTPAVLEGGGTALTAPPGDEEIAGDIPISGYCAIGVVNSKNQANVGTLWRSAYQLGAQFIFTVGTRYRHQPTDTVRAVQRMPLFELDSWSDFVEFAPRGAQWVAVEFGGTPLDEFEHPLDAVYLLGSEDAGLPKSVLRACHHTVSLRSERYASYNVAVAGSLVLYDRAVKEERRRREEDGS